MDEIEYIIPQAVDLSKKFTFNKKVDYIFHAACYAQPQKFITNKFETINETGSKLVVDGDGVSYKFFISKDKQNGQNFKLYFEYYLTIMASFYAICN